MMRQTTCTGRSTAARPSAGLGIRTLGANRRHGFERHNGTRDNAQVMEDATQQDNL